MIKSGGEWVSSIDLENAAMCHPSVQHAAAIGLPHPKWQERPLLIVVKAPGKDVTQQELRKFLESKLVKWWMPDAIEFVDALPLGATGKVLKRELRTRFADYTLPDTRCGPLMAAHSRRCSISPAASPSSPAARAGSAWKWPRVSAEAGAKLMSVRAASRMAHAGDQGPSHARLHRRGRDLRRLEAGRRAGRRRQDA